MLELSDGQSYLTPYMEGPNPALVLREHGTVTNNCFQKLDVLREATGKVWKPHQVVKALYFFRPSDESYVCFITPELGSSSPRFGELKPHIADLLGVSKTQAAKYRIREEYPFPRGMEHGTCPPFPDDDLVSVPVRGFIINDYEKSRGKVVDISIGGHGNLAHRTSAHLEFGLIEKILREEFGDDFVRRVTF